jgi:peptide subunit release factor 1 (eRF1)
VSACVKNSSLVVISSYLCSLLWRCRNGTSMISLVIPPRDQVSRISKMLADEYGTASNIKSRVNRLSVLGAITSTQQKLKLYSKVPPNGLVLYCGTILTDDGKEKRVNIDFEPFKPINTSLYLCDNKFHTEVRFHLSLYLTHTHTYTHTHVHVLNGAVRQDFTYIVLIFSVFIIFSTGFE